MATYMQWRRLFYEVGETKRAHYLVGPDRILVEDIVDAVRTRIDPPDIDYDARSAADDSHKTIWASLNQYPLDPKSKRLVVVRDVEKIKDWKPLLSWLGSRLIPQVHVVLVDSRAEVDTSREHIQAIAKTGRYVSCGPLNDADAFAFIGSICRIDADDCATLMERAGGDILSAANAARKAALLEARLDKAAISVFITPSPSELFEDALIALDKRAAAAAAAEVESSDYSRTIGALDFRLEQARKLATLVRRGTAFRDIVTSSKIPPFAIKKLMPHVKHYDRAAVRTRAAALAVADSALKRGNREGLLETLIAAW